MLNEQKNQVTAEAVQQTQALTDILRKEVDAETPLSATERAEVMGIRLSSRKVRMIQNTAELVRQQPGVLPPTFDLKEFELVAAHTIALDELLSVISRLEDAIYERFRTVGVRALTLANMANGYAAISDLTTEQLKTSITRLKSRRKMSSDSTTDPPGSVTDPNPPIPALKPADPTDQAA